MAGTREIKRKIKSIKSTKQITRAMELVAASKMKRAVMSATSIRPYAVNAMMVLTHLAEKTDPNLHPLLIKRDLNNCLIVMISPDRGLCGGLNTTLIKKVMAFEKEFLASHPKCNLQYMAAGKKAEVFLARTGRNLIAAYSGLSNNPMLKDILSLNKLIFDYYKNGDVDMVVLIYQNFISPVLQKPVVHQLLPFSRESVMEMGAGMGLFEADAEGGCAAGRSMARGEASGGVFGAAAGAEASSAARRETSATAAGAGVSSAAHSKISGAGAIAANAAMEYKFEPSASFILDNLLPGLIEMQIYHSVLESTASEHSSRMVAMHSATENASEMIDGLTLLFNQNRQASITREIAEISAGKVALGL